MIHKRFSEVEEFTAGDATLLKELLHPKNDDVDLPYSLAWARLEPGQASYPHRLLESAELYVFQRGRGEAIIDQEVIIVEADQLLMVPSGSEQYLRNTGDEPLVFLCIVSPPWSEAQDMVLSSSRWK